MLIMLTPYNVALSEGFHVGPLTEILSHYWQLALKLKF